MENVVDSLGWKRLSFILVILGVAILLFLFFSFAGNVTKNRQTLPTPNTQSPSPLTSSENFQIYNSPLFSVEYPQSFTASEGVINEGGSSVIFQNQEEKVNIEIQIYDPTITSVEKIENFFAGFGFTKSNIVIDGITANKLKGSIPHGSITIQETVVVFEKNKKIFKIQLTYRSQQENKTAEQQFSRMLSSFLLY